MAETRETTRDRRREHSFVAFHSLFLGKQFIFGEIITG
jgi:hypothetical protein